MVERIVIDRQAHRGVFSDQNRDKARTAHATSDGVEAVLRRQRHVGRELRQFGHIILEGFLQLRRGNGAHCNRQVLLRHITLGTRNDDLFQRRGSHLVVILSQCGQCL